MAAPTRLQITYTAIGLALLALVARLPAATINFVIGTDEAAYLTLAQNLAAGHGFTVDGLHPHTEFDPGYPLIASVIYWLTNSSSPSSNTLNKNSLELPAKINLLLGGLVVIPVYLLARKMYGEGIARRAGLLTALLPALVLSVPNFGASSEQVYTLCVWFGLLALWAGLHETRPRAWGFFALAGLAFGYAHLTRWEGAIYWLIGILWIGWAVSIDHKKSASTLSGDPPMHSVSLSKNRGAKSKGAFSTSIWPGNVSFDFARTLRQAQGAALRSGRLLDVLMWRSPVGILQATGKLLIFTLAFALLAVPYGIYLENAQGTWFSSKATTQQLQGEAVAMDDPLAWEREYQSYEQARTEPKGVVDWLKGLWINRDAEIKLYLRNWLLQLTLPFRSSSFLFSLWLPFAGLAWLKRQPEPGAVQRRVYLLSALVPLTFFPIAFVDARYLLSLTPVGLIWAAEGLVVAEEWLRRRAVRLPSYSLKTLTHRVPAVENVRAPLGCFAKDADFEQVLRSSRLPSYSLTGLICLVFAAASLIGPFLIPQPIEYKALGEWMRTNGIASGETVLARKRQVPFYADARWEWLPLADLEGVLAYAEDQHARYLVIDERTVPTLRPELAFLLDPTQAPTALRVVHVVEGSQKIVLYEIVESDKERLERFAFKCKDAKHILC